MVELVEKIKKNAEELMQKGISYLEKELVKIRAGKAAPNMLEGIKIDYYGSLVPIEQVANIGIVDARTISIQPWEKKILPTIEKGILASNIGLTPQNDGNIIRIYLPPLTEERRKELVKKTIVEGENAKVSTRNIRRECLEELKKLQKNGLSEDVCKNEEKEIQAITDKYIVFIEKILKTKEQEIMSI